MPREKLISDQYFKAAYNSAHTLQELADTLNIHILTVRSYCKRLSLPTRIYKRNQTRPHECLTAFKLVKGEGSLTWIHANSLFHDETMPQFRKRLRKAIEWLFDPIHAAEEEFPIDVLPLKPPRSQLMLIKVINAVWEDPALANKEPIFIAERTGLGIPHFIDYLNRCFEAAHKPPPVPEPFPEPLLDNTIELQRQKVLQQEAFKDAQESGQLKYSPEEELKRERQRILNQMRK